MLRRFALPAALGLLCCLASAEAATPHRWFPEFPIAEELLVVPFAGDVRQGMVLETAAGLLGRAALDGRTRTLLWEDLPNDGYERWFASYVADHAPKVTRVSLADAIRRLIDDGIVRGYIAYDLDSSDRPYHAAGKMDDSANVATSLAARLEAIAVATDLIPEYEALGLACVFDARGMTDADCLAQFGDEFATNALGLAEPRTRNARSLMVAMNTAVMSGVGDPYLQALARCEPDSPVIGWGCGSEDGITMPSSRYGLFQTATNWCHNLTVLAEAGGMELVQPWRPPQRPLKRSEHAANFTLTDGDNIQWLMGNFVGGSEAPFYYGNEHRGEVPFTWGIPGPGLAQLSPRTLAEVLETATPNDDFMLYSGGGYFYPDLYGSQRPEVGAMELQAERLAAYCELTGVRVLAFNFIDWDSPEAIRACETLARALPGLLGICAFQYYPYPAGEGRVIWVDGVDGDRVPIVSCRYTVWAQTGRPNDAPPSVVASMLREQDAGFSWVLVHAWSHFVHATDGSDDLDVAQDGTTEDSERGYEPGLWAAQQAADNVDVVSIHELLLRVREAGE